MAPPRLELTSEEEQVLLTLARDSVRYGVENNSVMPVRVDDYSKKLHTEKATFVTLKRYESLRGCIGVIAPIRPLVLDVVQNAYSAAFGDPRFPPLKDWELEGLQIDISVLSLLEPIAFSSEDDLLRKLRVNMDGLVLTDGLNRGAFLPVMWEQLPSPEEFLSHLKIKAGLSPDYWSSTIEVSRFITENKLRTSMDISEEVDT